MKDTEQAIFDKLPPVPGGATFTLEKVSTVSLPHPMMITPRHIEAAQSYGGLLTMEAMDEAPCGWKGCELKASEHEQMLSLSIRVPQNDDLNAVDGLHTYLLAVKELDLGLGGFAFPGPGQNV